jgi:hypothetical protein
MPERPVGGGGAFTGTSTVPREDAPARFAGRAAALPGFGRDLPEVLVRRREALTRLETGVVRRVPDLRRMAEANYREGTGDILELLDAMRSMRDIRLATYGSSRWRSWPRAR